MKPLATLLISLLLSASALPVHAQRSFPQPTENETGFEQILTAARFDEWEGDPTYWRFEDGVLIGEVTEETLLEENSFIVWRGGTVSDFELKVEYRVSVEGNSGINYRSEDVEGTAYALRGYQADIDGPNRWSGQLYEERGREFLALRGQVTHVTEEGTPQVIGSVGDRSALTESIRDGEWNEYYIIGRGNYVVHMINGRVMSIVIDDDPDRRAAGLLGVQVHQGPPMTIEYRNLRLKRH